MAKKIKGVLARRADLEQMCSQTSGAMPRATL